MIRNILFNISFEIYESFVIEEKFGFNKQTFKLYIKDKIISYFVSITILSVFLYFYIWIVASTGDYFFFYVKILLRFKFLS